jgi:hypothetical protein
MVACLYSIAQLKQKSHFVEVKILLLDTKEDNLLHINCSAFQIILCYNNNILFLIQHAD